MSKRKFCNKFEMPENIVGYEYMEDTEIPYLKRITRVERGKKVKSWFFCEPIFTKVKYNRKVVEVINYPKFCYYSGKLACAQLTGEEGIDKLNGVYFVHEGSVYYLDNGTIEKKQIYDYVNKQLLVELGIIDLKDNIVTKFLTFLQGNKYVVKRLESYGLIVVASASQIIDLGSSLKYYDFDGVLQDQGHGICEIHCEKMTHKILADIYEKMQRVIEKLTDPDFKESFALFCAAYDERLKNEQDS